MAQQHKRKRDTDDMGAPRAAPGMTDDTFAPHSHFEMHTSDPNMEFVAQHNAEFGASTEAQQDHVQDPVQLEGSDNPGQSASDTAAAAMAQFHNMQVPQPTEQAFMTHTGDGGDRPGSSSLDQSGLGGQHRSSFADFDVNAFNKPDQSTATNGEGSPILGGAANGGGQKPQVGSDEWHKVRRDNHKEGTRCQSSFPPTC